MKGLKHMKCWTIAVVSCAVCLVHTARTNIVEAYEGLGGPPHIGTFEGSTTFTTSSSNGINPGLYLEVMDTQGNYTEYTSEDGVITIQGTKEGAYVTQAKLLGKTKYVDQQTGEILDQWEDGRDLKLESVQMPVLTTTGKNLFNNGFTTISNYDNQLYSRVNLNKIIGKNGNFTISILEELNSKGKIWFNLYINGTEKFNLIVNGATANKKYNFLLNEQNQVEFGLYCEGISKQQALEIIKNDFKIQVEEGSIVTEYEPYKSNILTVNEDVTLRGIGDVQDTLDLMTGEVKKNVSDLETLEDISKYTQSGNTTTDTLVIIYSIGGTSKSGDRKFISTHEIAKYGRLVEWYGGLSFRFALPRSDSRFSDLNTFKSYIKDNPFEYIRVLEEEEKSIKTVGLNSTYYFDPVLNRDVRVNGTIVPLVASVTIPTDPLSFIIDPNQDEGMEFIAPEFSITNQTPGSIYLNLKAFEQTTNVLNDVLPTTYPDWHQLDKHQSKDIALALVPKPSDGWMSLTEGPRYVADSSNYELGMVKAKSTVDFTFSALHGRTFVEELNPQYRLSFEFGF